MTSEYYIILHKYKLWYSEKIIDAYTIAEPQFNDKNEIIYFKAVDNCTSFCVNIHEISKIPDIIKKAMTNTILEAPNYLYDSTNGESNQAWIDAKEIINLPTKVY